MKYQFYMYFKFNENNDRFKTFLYVVGIII